MRLDIILYVHCQYLFIFSENGDIVANRFRIFFYLFIFKKRENSCNQVQNIFFSETGTQLQRGSEYIIFFSKNWNIVAIGFKIYYFFFKKLEHSCNEVQNIYFFLQKLEHICNQVQNISFFLLKTGTQLQSCSEFIFFFKKPEHSCNEFQSIFFFKKLERSCNEVQNILFFLQKTGTQLQSGSEYIISSSKTGTQLQRDSEYILFFKKLEHSFNEVQNIIFLQKTNIVATKFRIYFFS